MLLVLRWCPRWHCLMTLVVLHPWHGAAVPVWTTVCPAVLAMAWPDLAVPVAG